MFAIIDVFTRRAYIKPMKNKAAEECCKALESVIKMGITLSYYV